MVEFVDDDLEGMWKKVQWITYFKNAVTVFAWRDERNYMR